MDDNIATSAEAAENAVLPHMYEVHTDPTYAPQADCMPDSMKRPCKEKSAARWAYERLILYIRNFEEQLDSEHEVAMGFTGGNTGVLRIEGMGYFDPDIVTFYGSDAGGARNQLVQHVSQLNVLLRAMPKPDADKPAYRIGFRLAADLE
ncbi:DUF6173 family protein [Pontibaca salina]|uniref:Uncharacterized protein n=1 Tax=Pontibaca salina TaxID=2795731 RepID=A0A934HPF1_9RHOB|nr:DUF6173 family protein [Pontibaca salina]MBI6629312.1 hypothetical protein [Pontibaca salina]